MLKSINQINEEFFSLFSNLEMGCCKCRFMPHYRYAKKSSYDYAEEDKEPMYPCIAVQDYAPTLSELGYIDMRQYFDGAMSEDGLKGYTSMRPLNMEFTYDVSVAAKGYGEHTTMKDYFLKHFVYGERFIFDKHLDGENTVGDIVPYKVYTTDIPRTDGIFETNYEFHLFAWLYLKEPEEFDLVKEIILNCSPKVMV